MIDLNEYLGRYSDLISTPELLEELNSLGAELKRMRDGSGRILFFGNGASASIASHAALDFTKQGKLQALCFHDPALVTAYANDYGYENAFWRIAKAYANQNDTVIMISTSGESENLIRLADFCNDEEISTVSFTGRHFDNTLRSMTRKSFWVDSHAYNIVENCHSIWITSLIDYLVGKAEYEVK